MYVCVCNAVTEAQVRESVADGAQTLEDLQLATGVATCCGTCADAACGYLAAEETAVPQPVLTPGDCAPVRWVSRAPHAYAKAA